MGDEILWVLGIAALLNFQAFLVVNLPRIGRISRSTSPVFGLAAWTALAYLTGGVHSPFIAGFGIEIILSAMTIAVSGTLLVTVGAVMALWAQQARLGTQGAMTSLTIQTAFLLAMGGITFLLTWLWAGAQQRLTRRHAQLRDRLRALEAELSDARLVGKVGENTARLAHDLKNTVHSLRGFTSLIEPDLVNREANVAALDGLRAAIDRLEDLARLTLGPRDPSDDRGSCSVRVAYRTIEEVTAEISLTYPDINLLKSLERDAPKIPIPSRVLREVLLVLLANAAEAMRGRGEVVLETRSTGEDFRIKVRDHGCGLPSSTLANLFKPGFTTKPGGSGYGLYLARRLLDTYGGRLMALPARGGGTMFLVTLPAHKTSP